MLHFIKSGIKSTLDFHKFFLQIMKLSKLYIAIIGIAFIYQCQQYSHKRNTKKENYCMVSQYVINHYKNNKWGSMATKFLTSNIQHHSFPYGTTLDSMKSLYRMDMLNSIGYTYFPSKQDTDVITADLLIENIDYALKAWKEHKWSKHYSFKDFCEYVLPYRVGDEPLEKWRKMYYEKYNPILDSLYQGDDAVEAARILANYLKQEGFTNKTDFILPHLGASFLFHNRIGYCRENCDIALYAMRSVGIPVATDFYEISPSYDSRHFWTAVIDTNHCAIPFNYTEKEISRSKQEERKKGKVYRIYFNKQEKGIKASKGVPFFFKQPLIRDVTEAYFPHTEACVKISQNKQEQYMYLSIFSKKRYIPIDFSEEENGTYRFQGIEQDLVYFPTWYKDGHIQCATYPFLLKSNVTKFLKPCYSRKKTVCLKRKYPLLKGRDFVKNIRGVKIEASTTKDFKHPILLYEFKDIPKINRLVIATNVKRRYRYIRYTATQQQKIELGEFHVYEKGRHNITFPINITSSEKLDSIHIRDLRLITDGEWESFYMSRNKGTSLTFDYGKPIFIDHIIVIPRNDDNYIHIGDSYELFYHQGAKGWKSLGRRVATSSHIHFTSVPSNALFWLHNHTRGTEERPFYMEYGKQIFP